VYDMDFHVVHMYEMGCYIKQLYFLILVLLILLKLL
jgi:hypothetical protein